MEAPIAWHAGNYLFQRSAMAAFVFLSQQVACKLDITRLTFLWFGRKLEIFIISGNAKEWIFESHCIQRDYFFLIASTA